MSVNNYKVKKELGYLEGVVNIYGDLWWGNLTLTS